MKSKSNTGLMQILNIIFFLATIAVNALANILPLNNQNTGEISDKYPNLFVPTGLTFSVWGVIYIGLFLFILYQLGLFSKKTGSHKEVVSSVRWLFILSCTANIAWIFAWHYDYIYVSLGCMLILLFSLILIQSKFNRKNPSGAERWFFQVPFGIYFGWITVATIANATAVLVYAGWNGFGFSEVFWTAAVISVAALITVLQLLQKNDIAYALVVAWALAGIIIKHVTAFSSQYSAIIWAAATAIAFIVLFMGLTLVKHFRKKIV